MVSPLDRKLLRDLWQIKGQALAIGLVIALGVMMLVMMDGLVNTLDETRRAYYERYRLAEVFAPVKRAPRHLLDKLSEIPGASAVEGRVSGSVLINLEEAEVPISAQAVSLPDFGTPRLNDIYLVSGRMLDHEHADEVLLLKSFADARKLFPGDSFAATMNGARRTFNIVGIAQSPEFLYTTAPGELAPDPARFAVIWMSETSLASAYDLEGAFNEALLALDRNANLPAVLTAVDRLLAAYGGLGSYGLEDHSSNRFVTEEISGLEASAIGVPPVFLGVAAFLLYIVVSRIVQSERGQIGLLKAFGYTSMEVGQHYLKLVLVIAVLGAVSGSLMGVAAGRGMAGIYQEYYKFPFIVFQVNSSAFVTGFVVSILTASLGGLLVLRGIFALTPAVAMRPPAPADYSRAGRLLVWMKPFLDQPSRMIVRRIVRQPGRMAGAVVGIAIGMALSVGMISVMDGFDQTLDLTFTVLDRSDATVSFTNPISNKSVYELKRIEGIDYVEPVRSVPVVFRNGLFHYRGAIEGLRTSPRLNRALDSALQPIPLPEGGIVLSKPVADILRIATGELLTVEVHEGRRPVLQTPVAGISKTLLGSPTYMDLDSLNRLLKEPNRVSGAHLALDEAKSANVYRIIKDMPAVAGITLKQESKAAFEKLMDSGAGAIRYVMALIAAVITFGIVYNSARIAFAERERDLASLRVIGFTKGETAFVLLGELGLITLLALPLGGLLGYFLSFVISKGFSTDIYQIPATFSARSFASAMTAVILAAVASGWLVKRDIDRIDMVSALKTRE